MSQNENEHNQPILFVSLTGSEALSQATSSFNMNRIIARTLGPSDEEEDTERLLPISSSSSSPHTPPLPINRTTSSSQLQSQAESPQLSRTSPNDNQERTTERRRPHTDTEKWMSRTIPFILIMGAWFISLYSIQFLTLFWMSAVISWVNLANKKMAQAIQPHPGNNSAPNEENPTLSRDPESLEFPSIQTGNNGINNSNTNPIPETTQETTSDGPAETGQFRILEFTTRHSRFNSIILVLFLLANIAFLLLIQVPQVFLTCFLSDTEPCSVVIESFWLTLFYVLFNDILTRLSVLLIKTVAIGIIPLDPGHTRTLSADLPRRNYFKLSFHQRALFLSAIEKISLSIRIFLPFPVWIQYFLINITDKTEVLIVLFIVLYSMFKMNHLGRELKPTLELCKLYLNQLSNDGPFGGNAKFVSPSSTSFPSDESHPENSSNECPICLDDIPHYGIQLACSHIFCENCINQWAVTQQHNSCPICRASIYSQNEMPRVLDNGATTSLPEFF